MDAFQTLTYTTNYTISTTYTNTTSDTTTYTNTNNYINTNTSTYTSTFTSTDKYTNTDNQKTDLTYTEAPFDVWKLNATFQELENTTEDEEDLMPTGITWIFLVFLPVILAVGTVGNILTFLVMMQKQMVSSSTSFLLAILAISDTIFLYMGIPWLLTYAITKERVDTDTLINCGLAYFLYYCSCEFSSWILLTLSLERAIYVSFPLRAKSICSTRNVRHLSCGILLTIAGINVHHFFTVGEVQEDGLKWCDASKPEYDYFLTYVWPWIDTLIYVLIPAVTISILNSLIIHRMYKATRANKEGNVSSSALSKSARKTTVMLLSVSSCFICLMIPGQVMYIVYEYDGEGTQSVLFPISEILFYSNHAINFILYMITAKKFRGELKRMLGVRGRQVGDSFRVSASTALEDDHTM